MIPYIPSPIRNVVYDGRSSLPASETSICTNSVPHLGVDTPLSTATDYEWDVPESPGSVAFPGHIVLRGFSESFTAAAASIEQFRQNFDEPNSTGMWLMDSRLSHPGWPLRRAFTNS